MPGTARALKHGTSECSRVAGGTIAACGWLDQIAAAVAAHPATCPTVMAPEGACKHFEADLAHADALVGDHDGGMGAKSRPIL